MFERHVDGHIERHDRIHIRFEDTEWFEGTGLHIGKGYIYFAMCFSLGVELLNMRLRRKQKPVELHEPKLPS